MQDLKTTLAIGSLLGEASSPTWTVLANMVLRKAPKSKQIALTNNPPKVQLRLPSLGPSGRILGGGLPCTSWESPGTSWEPPVALLGNNLFPPVPPTADVTTNCSHVWSARAKHASGWPSLVQWQLSLQKSDPNSKPLLLLFGCEKAPLGSAFLLTLAGLGIAYLL